MEQSDGKSKPSPFGGFDLGADFVIDFGSPKKKTGAAPGKKTSTAELLADLDIDLDLDEDIDIDALEEAISKPAKPPVKQAEPELGGIDLTSLIELDLSEMLEPEDIAADALPVDGVGSAGDAPVVVYAGAPENTGADDEEANADVPDIDGIITPAPEPEAPVTDTETAVVVETPIQSDAETEGSAIVADEATAVEPTVSTSTSLSEDDFPDIDWVDDDDPETDPVEETLDVPEDIADAVAQALAGIDLGKSDEADDRPSTGTDETKVAAPPDPELVAQYRQPENAEGADFDELFEVFDEAEDVSSNDGDDAVDIDVVADTDSDEVSIATSSEPSSAVEPAVDHDTGFNEAPGSQEEFPPEQDETSAPQTDGTAPVPPSAPPHPRKIKVAPPRPVPPTASPSAPAMPQPPASASNESPKAVEANEVLRQAVTLHGQGKLEEAATLYRKLIAAKQDMPGPWINLGVLLRRTGHLEPAIACLRRGVALKPEDGSAWSNLGNAYRALNRLDHAEEAQRQALERTPGAAQIHYNLGLVLRDKGELTEALECFERARLLGYTKAELIWDRGLTHLLNGSLSEGFGDYEARWDLPESTARHTRIPRWKGASLKNRTILVWNEQGFGDSVNFCRYVPMLRDHDPRAITFEVQPALVALLRSSSAFDGIEIVPQGAPTKGRHNFQVPLLSLPGALGTTLDTIPADVPYLTTPSGREQFGLPDGVVKIGLCWAGKPSHRNDRNRSLTIEAFAPILETPGATFVSLQKGPRAKDIEKARLEPFVRDVSGTLKDFEATAAAIGALDLVITVDTSVAHLAGALGKPVWVLLPFAPDWRWMLHRDDSPWYPTMTLFRQTSPGDWREVFNRVRHKLNRRIKDGALI